jgi:hypothetical protein
LACQSAFGLWSLLKNPHPSLSTSFSHGTRRCFRLIAYCILVQEPSISPRSCGLVSSSMVFRNQDFGTSCENSCCGITASRCSQGANIVYVCILYEYTHIHIYIHIFTYIHTHIYFCIDFSVFRNLPCVLSLATDYSLHGNSFFCCPGAWIQGLHLEPLHQPFVCVLDIFKKGSHELLPGLALNVHPPDLCLLSSYDYRLEPPAPSSAQQF